MPTFWKLRGIMRYASSTKFLAVIAFAALGSPLLRSQPQTFSSGSTGADGPLNLTTPGVVYFDPKNVNPGLHPNGDTVYNFTTINIADGVTVILSSKLINGPVHWLATGAVQINGTINLSGENGTSPVESVANRIPAAAGAGGYGGGIGGNASNPPQPGGGPAGGAAQTASSSAGAGTFTGNAFLIPLVGGSGGGGGLSACGEKYAGGGGAGGGALLIASSVVINMDGASIQAKGGDWTAACGQNGGAGSGGAIRLMAPVINVTTTTGRASYISVKGGTFLGTGGRIRLEAFTQNWNGDNLGLTGPYTTSVPFAVATPAAPAPLLHVASVAGITINANPFTFPDATINTGASVPVNIEAHNIPLGTSPKLYIFPETGPDIVITCSPLTGTVQSSTSTATIAFPSGGSRGYVKATW